MVAKKRSMGVKNPALRVLWKRSTLPVVVGE